MLLRCVIHKSVEIFGKGVLSIISDESIHWCWPISNYNTSEKHVNGNGTVRSHLQVSCNDSLNNDTFLCDYCIPGFEIRYTVSS